MDFLNLSSTVYTLSKITSILSTIPPTHRRIAGMWM